MNLASRRYLPLFIVIIPLLGGCVSNSGKFKSREDNLVNSRAQLSEPEVLDIDPLAEITEYDIQQASKNAEKDRFKIPYNSRIVLVQSGQNVPDMAMQKEMMNHYQVSVYSGISPQKAPIPIAKKSEEQRQQPQPNYIKSLRLSAARAKQNKIVVYWSHFELGIPNSNKTLINWIPYYEGPMNQKARFVRYSIRFITVDVKTGVWVMYTPPNDEIASIKANGEKIDQLISVKEQAYASAAAYFAKHFTDKFWSEAG